MDQVSKTKLEHNVSSPGQTHRSLSADACFTMLACAIAFCVLYARVAGASCASPGQLQFWNQYH